MSTNPGIEVDQPLIVLTLFHLKVRRALPDVDLPRPISDQPRLITQWDAACTKIGIPTFQSRRGTFENTGRRNFGESCSPTFEIEKFDFRPRDLARRGHHHTLAVLGELCASTVFDVEISRHRPIFGRCRPIMESKSTNP